MNETKHLIISGFASNIIGRIGKKLLAMLISIILIRNLTVSDYGVFNLFVSCVMMLVAFHFGVDNFFQRYFSKINLCDKGSSFAFFIQMLSLRLCVSLFIISILYISAYFKWISLENFHFSYWGGAVVVGLIFVTHTFCSSGLNSAFIDNEYLNIAYVLGDTFKLILFWLIWDSNIYTSIVIWGSGEAIVLVLVISRFLYRLHPKFVDLLKVKKISFDYHGHFFYAKYMFFASFSNWVLSTQIDLYFISYMLSNQDVGYYSFAAKIPFLILFLSPSNLLRSVAIPILFKKVDSGIGIDQISGKIVTFLKLSIWGWTLLSLFILLNIKFIVRVVFDPKYIHTIPFMFIWFALLYTNVVKVVFEPIAMSIEYVKVFNATFLAAIFNVAGNMILIPLFGLHGAIISTGFSICFQNITIIYFVSKKIGMTPDWMRTFVTIVIIAMLYLIVFILQVKFSGLTYMLVNNFVLAIVLVFGFRMYFKAEEISYLRSFVPDRKLQ